MLNSYNLSNLDEEKAFDVSKREYMLASTIFIKMHITSYVKETKYTVIDSNEKIKHRKSIFWIDCNKSIDTLFK